MGAVGAGLAAVALIAKPAAADAYVPVVISAPDFVNGDDSIPFSVEGMDHTDDTTLTITWDPSGGSSPITASSPLTITVPGGQTGVTFSLGTRNVGGTVTVYATAGGNTVQTSVDVLAHS
jgi:hypothetical protein